MKQSFRIFVFLSLTVFFISCGYKTKVVNTVHRDGSITQSVFIESIGEKFEPKNYQVPVESDLK